MRSFQKLVSFIRAKSPEFSCFYKGKIGCVPLKDRIFRYIVLKDCIFAMYLDLDLSEQERNGQRLREGCCPLPFLLSKSPRLLITLPLLNIKQQ